MHFAHRATNHTSTLLGAAGFLSSASPPSPSLLAMDDPAWAWPAWKFGMKRDDLFTTLQDRYNTFTFTLQDPEAFHHDVSEISHDAETPEEFHRLMADRQRQRQRELSQSLETLAVEIIANPKLMGSEQWQHALQLFRTKSYDSIVRYFASYLPEEYLDHHETQSTSSTFSETDSVSTTASSVDDAASSSFLNDFFPNGCPDMTAEPCSVKDDERDASNAAPQDLPSPPHSEAAQSGPSVSSQSPSPSSVADSNEFSTNPPSRSMSFSGSESGHTIPELLCREYRQKEFDETSQSDCEASVASVCDSVETPPPMTEGAAASHYMFGSSKNATTLDFADEEDFSTTQFPEDDFDYLDMTPCYDTLDSDTPTPRPEAHAPACYMELRSVMSKKVSSHQRSPSPKSHPPTASRAPGFPACEVRRSPEESQSKIQKDFARRRPTGRRRMV